MNLTRRLRAATGLDLSVAAVERAVRERMQRTGAGIDYDPQPDTAEFDALVDLVVVPESWILRDPAVFETALRFVQRHLLTHPGRQVRVLSLPCAGGEEPYSLAMLLARAGIGPEHCRIDGFDVSHAAIERARAGPVHAFAHGPLDRGDRQVEAGGGAQAACQVHVVSPVPNSRASTSGASRRAGSSSCSMPWVSGATLPSQGAHATPASSSGPSMTATPATRSHFSPRRRARPPACTSTSRMRVS